MRIIYMLSENLNKTSGIVHFMAVTKGLQKLGHSVSILGPRYHRQFRKPENVHGFYIPVPGRNVFSFVLFQFLVPLLFPVIYLLYRPDVILIRGGGGLGFLVHIIARLCRVKVVLEVNGIPWLELIARGFSRWLAKISKLLMSIECRTANHVIAVTPLIAEDLICASGISPQKVTVIQNGADPDEFNRDNRSSKRLDMSIQPDKLVIGFIGFFSPWHGSKEIIESALFISPEIKEKIVYLMVGHGEGWHEAKQMVIDKGLEDIVRLPGRASRAQVADYLSIFDVGMLINSCEGITRNGTSPLKFWEYLAAGLPVIISDNLNLNPIVRNENMGLILTESSPQNIAKAIEEIFRKRDDFAEIGKRNRKLVEEKYSWSEVSKKVSEVLAG
ncbi:MAG: glycosyltransferase family 4 protein [Pseudomonadota bacterium]